jgi:hypothetical protein
MREDRVAGAGKGRTGERREDGSGRGTAPEPKRGTHDTAVCPSLRLFRGVGEPPRREGRTVLLSGPPSCGVSPPAPRASRPRCRARARPRPARVSLRPRGGTATHLARRSSAWEGRLPPDERPGSRRKPRSPVRADVVPAKIRGVPSERMNSPLEIREVRLRGLPRRIRASCTETNSAHPMALARAGPVGAGRHHVVDAAISIAAARSPPPSLRPPPRRGPPAHVPVHGTPPAAGCLHPLPRSLWERVGEVYEPG